MLQPLISIIIPTYNRAYQIGETIDSIVSQSYDNWECLIIDDGSTDYTEELLTFYCIRNPKIKYFKRDSTTKGAPRCRNIGLEKAQGEFCIFLDSDDLLLHSCIENRIKRIETDPDKNFWVFPMFLKTNKREHQRMIIPKKESYLQDFLQCRIHWGIMCTLWEINFVRSLKGFKELYPRLNDPEIHIRAMILSGLNYKVYDESTPDSVYRPAIFEMGPEIAKKYLESLILFIPDISSELKANDLYLYRVYLKGYLWDYMTKAYSFNGRRGNIFLFKIFYKYKILTFRQFSLLISQYYSILILSILGKNVRKKMNNLLKN